jgi:hypothetical protein
METSIEMRPIQPIHLMFSRRRSDASGRVAIAPQEGPYDLGIVIWGKPKFADAMNAVANILLAYAGTAAL